MISVLDWTQVTHFWLQLNKLLLIILWSFIDRNCINTARLGIPNSLFAVVFNSIRHKYRVDRNSKVGIANRHTE
jgi:hypothetical protein